MLFDKRYVDFGHPKDLDERAVFWMTRAKDDMAYASNRFRINQEQWRRIVWWIDVPTRSHFPSRVLCAGALLFRIGKRCPLSLNSAGITIPEIADHSISAYTEMFARIRQAFKEVVYVCYQVPLFNGCFNRPSLGQPPLA